MKVKKYAFTGIAATLMQDAVTFNSGLFIPVPKKGESTNQKIAPLRSVTNTAACSFVQVEYEDIDYIVLDELSMMDGTQIGNISDHLNAYEVKHPYRGKLCEYDIILSSWAILTSFLQLLDRLCTKTSFGLKTSKTHLPNRK